MTINPSMPTDLTNCDREPIHLLGAIQPIGFLLGLADDWTIERASANLEAFTGRTVKEVIGRSLDEVFELEAVHALRNRAAMLLGDDAVERLFHLSLIGGRDRFDVAVHIADGRTIIEAQPSHEPGGDATNTVRSMVARLDRTPDMPRFFNEGARLVRALTGYDRVMLYRFAEDGSGEVVAEAARTGIGSFKGLHYPATDIPRQARALYKRNLLRIISDTEAVPVPVVPARDSDGRLLDLSLSVLRSVSPIHIEYLRNMGVRASMSISIIVDDRLWGLFACHHYEPMSPTFQRRSVCELLAQMFSMRLESRERRELVDFERHAREISDQLLGAVASDDTLLNDPDWLGDILTSAIPADGVGVWINGSHALSGSTPKLGDFRKIVAALTEISPDRVYSTDRIADLVPEAGSFAADSAGMLAIPISRAAPNFVILFRQELVRSVSWGGDPHKPVEYGPNGPRLTPRESFAEWRETVKERARPFTASERRVAETLRATLVEVVLRMADAATVQRQQASERQELLIAELNHRVRNILGVIRGLIRQSKPHDQSIDNFIALVDGRIHALARAHNQITDDHWGPAPIQALIDAETAAFLADGADRVRSSGGHVLLHPQAYSTMALVIHELVTNSAKYGSLSDSGTVSIDWAFDPAGDLVMTWREAGGPPVRAPTRKGFGTTIIERSVPYDLGGEVEVDYPESGVTARFRIPARHVSQTGKDVAPRLRFARPAVGHPAPPPDSILDGQRLLLVEDSLIIALDAEDILVRLGAAAVNTASTVEAAVDAIETWSPSLAILDINLGDRTSYPVADRLRADGVPYLFASGYGEQADLPAAHADRAVVQKPYTLENIARALDDLLARRDG